MTRKDKRIVLMAVGGVLALLLGCMFAIHRYEQSRYEQRTITVRAVTSDLVATKVGFGGATRTRWLALTGDAAYIIDSVPWLQAGKTYEVRVRRYADGPYVVAAREVIIGG